MLHSLILEVREVMHLCSMRLNLWQHLLFAVTFKMPVARITHIFAMELLHHVFSQSRQMRINYDANTLYLSGENLYHPPATTPTIKNGSFSGTSLLAH
jgi:hypothetical protein